MGEKESFEERAKEAFAQDQQEPEISVADMLALFGHGRIGEIELRNWLAEIYPSFKRARRHDIDEWLEKAQQQLNQEEDQTVTDESQFGLDLDEEE